MSSEIRKKLFRWKQAQIFNEQFHVFYLIFLKFKNQINPGCPGLVDKELDDDIPVKIG